MGYNKELLVLMNIYKVAIVLVVVHIVFVVYLDVRDDIMNRHWVALLALQVFYVVLKKKQVLN